MKKLSTIVAGLFFLLCNLNAQSKTGTDYFAGKWSVLVKGTPNGDARMFVVLEKNDSTITGVVQDSTGTEVSKITSADLQDSVLTVYFNAQGYDVNMMMTKKDDDHVTGSLIGMFDAEGERVK